MVTVIAILSILIPASASMITGDFSQMVYKPKRSAVYLVLRYRFAIIAVSVGLWLLALALDFTFLPGNGPALLVTGLLLTLFIILGFFMSPYVMFPSIKKPEWISLTEADSYIENDEPVIGLSVGDDARAYPVKWTFRPHIVEDVVGGEPVVMTYCLLSNAGVALSPRLGDDKMNLIMPIQWENNMMIYDTVGHRLIQQIDGSVMFGDDAGSELRSFPTQIVSWSRWKELHPGTRLFFNPSSGFFDRFVRFFIGRFFLEANLKREKPMFPTIRRFDDRLPNKEEVIGIKSGDESRAYTMDYLSREGVVTDTIDGKSVVLLSDGDAANVLDPRHEGRKLVFDKIEGGFAAIMADRETGSEWDVEGTAVSGPLAGAKLSPLFHYNRVLWYIWSNFHPNSELVTG